MRFFLAPSALVLLAAVASCGGPNGTTGPSTVPRSGGQPAPDTFSTLGQFEVSFAADPKCTALPSDSRTRTYTTALSRGQSSATLSGGHFPSGAGYSAWNVLYTRVDGESADIWFQDPPVWESLSDDSYLVIYGLAQGRIAGDTSTLQFWGKFQYCPEREPDGYPECEVPETICESTNHQLTLRRRQSQ